VDSGGRALSDPFGEADGGKAPVHELMSQFLPFDDEKSALLAVRVLSGRKGSGKTVALRRLHTAALENDSIYVPQMESEAPPTDDVVRFTTNQMQAGLPVEEEWIQAWRRAIVRSVATHLLYATVGEKALCPDASEALHEYIGKILPRIRVPSSPYRQLSSLIRTSKGRSEDDELWEEVEFIIAKLLQRTRPLYFFVDAGDEYFHAAPRYWLECQKGLFHAIIQIVRKPEFGNRIHVVATLRDVAFAAACVGEHATRFLYAGRVKSLDWTYDSIQAFLQAKLQRVPEPYLIAPAETTPIRRWLGRDTIWNDRLKIEEDAKDYLVRHTRLIPRDVIAMGNALCEAVVAQKALGAREVPESVIRSYVSESARQFGNEQMGICANELACEVMPREAATRSSDFYLANKHFIGSLETELRDLIRGLELNRIDREMLRRAIDRGRNKFDDVNVFSVLWKNGLIGYLENVPAGSGTREVFFDSTIGRRDFRFPEDKDEYVFHPCLIDSVGIRGVGAPSHRQ
jgi:hypothetical protein